MNDKLQASAADFAYYNGTAAAPTTTSSILISSSPYLNNGQLRELIAQEMLRRNGPDLPNTAFIPNVVQIMNQMEDYPRIEQLFEEEKKRLPEFRKWLDERKQSNFTAEECKGAAPGTLRAVIYDFLANSGYDIDHFYKGMKIETDLEFYRKERVHTHDIEHMITGFETDHGGELALLTANSRAIYKYFTPELANYMFRTQSYLRAKTIMKSGLFYPESAAQMQDYEDVGAAMGRSWKHPLFIVPFRDYLDWQVTDIREEFGIKNVQPSGVWAHTTALSEDPRPEYAQAAE
ncbi:hypothetical protein [Sphingomonas crocodyli]|uniref:Ubiquinone biosynthesis protein n=1 Tax=Sphingomonas crocodyli TaxID=1979270 RepID=A0A437M8R7_9SPHN|nr:hypothetical protein [Sphingomonas crocodyli]RVT93925.1 hypothetical protein EOD43_08705 [Sphingomonas crocodyli]